MDKKISCRWSGTVNSDENHHLFATKRNHIIRAQITTRHKLGKCNRGRRCCRASLTLMDKSLNRRINSLTRQTPKCFDRSVPIMAETNGRNHGDKIRHNQNHQATNNDTAFLFHATLG